MNTSLSTQSLSSSASTMLSGTKWRNGLVRLSKKLKRPTSRHCSPLSGTAAAAATEKLIRRPHATIQTEDLTASQFAYMAGIKIKRGRNHQEEDNDALEPSMILGEFDETEEEDTEDDYSDDDESMMMMNDIVPVSLDHRQRRQLTTRMGTTKMQQGSISGMTSWSYSSSTTTTRCPPIWDVRFWQQQQQQNQQQQQQDQPGDSVQKENTTGGGSLLRSSNSHYSDLSATETISTMDTSIANSISSTSLSSATSSASFSTATKPRVFHKGRFQIVLGGDTEDHCNGEPLVRTTSSDSGNVVEWHRKRTLTQ
ncbi:hypothetical protein [Absidia glauca]|uniref:Uncharacterized protein n=1 Tax=Absidia glauca TaxID=4829 RepID=A0A168RV72_ABSGL|nr:hypothetical protein [Absidia glauca]